MSIALVTGSAGLVGTESVAFLSGRFDRVLGVDNNMREAFFGPEASTHRNREWLERGIGNYRHHADDIRDAAAMEALFKAYGQEIRLVVHTAAQPSHNWAAENPFQDFTVNANGTLIVLEMTRRYCPEAVFIFTSTNKVYGDRSNRLPLFERETRWEVDESHPYHDRGIDESMSIDQSRHSLFGASKAAGDLLAQEYGRYFGMRTGVFRAGCLTGPKHCGTQWHGFLSYLMKCAVTGEPYTVFGYKGKQVRDNMHSFDLVNMFWHFYRDPRPGEVYNVGGGRHSNCSVLEAVAACEKLAGKKMNRSYSDIHRAGDHIWWLSDVSKFRRHYPAWDFTFNLDDILGQIFEDLMERL